MTKRNLLPVNNELYTEADFMKDCPQSQFIPTTLGAVHRIIAIGDIHGDLELARRSFRLAKLIDNEDNWIAQPASTIVVQVGDQIDSCRPIPGVHQCHVKKSNDKAEDINVMEFFNRMHLLASKVGGACYSLLGNHEIMNVQGNFNYVSYNNLYGFRYGEQGLSAKKFEGPAGRKEAFGPGGPIASMLACTRTSILVIGSNMFVHAGLLPILASKLEHLNLDSQTKLKYLNAVVRKWLLNKLSDAEIQTKKFMIDDINTSPFWTRIYGSIPPNVDLNSTACFLEVKKALEVYKIGKMIVGHTPQPFTNETGINGTCYEAGRGNTLYRIDGGFSRAFEIFNNTWGIQVLEIIDDKHFKIIMENAS